MRMLLCGNPICLIVLTCSLAFWLPARFAQGQGAISNRAHFVRLAQEMGLAVDTNTINVSTGKPSRTSLCKVTSRNLTVEFEQESGKVRWVKNDAARGKALEGVQQSKREGRTNIPTKKQDDAITLAVAYSEKFGQPISAEMKLGLGRFQEDEGEWIFSWFRHVKGYRFEEEAVSVHLDDATGELCVYKNSVTGRECPIDLRVTEAVAKETAEERVNAMLPTLARGNTLEVAEVGKPTLLIVYPNTIYRESTAVPHAAGSLDSITEPRLVYEVNFSFSATGKGTMRRSRPPIALWIDAASGQLVGGR